MKKTIIAVLLVLLLTATAAFASGYVYGSDGDSNLRTGPGLGYEDIGTVLRGTYAEYLGSSKTDNRGVVWYKVNYEGITGWVSSRYTEMVSGYSPVAYVYGANGSSNIHTGPKLSAKKIGVLSKGDAEVFTGQTAVDGRGIEWYQIYYNGDTAWVSSVYTELK